MYVSVEGGFSTNCFECCVNGGMRASFKRSFGLWYLRRFIGLGLMFDIGDADSIKWQVRNVGETTRDFKRRAKTRWTTGWPGPLCSFFPRLCLLESNIWFLCQILHMIRLSESLCISEPLISFISLSRSHTRYIVYTYL